MSDLHQRFFKLYLMELDGHPLSPAQRSETQAHLSACPSCRADVQLYQGLHARAAQRWISAPAPLSMENIVQADQRHTRVRYLTLPLRAVFWTGFAVLLLVLVEWIFTNLGPAPAVLPVGTSTPKASTPTPTAVPASSDPSPRVYDSPSEMILDGNLLPSQGREDYDYFGGSLDMDGDVLVTGAPLWNSPGVAAGRAYIFRKSAAGEWLSEATLTASDRDDGFQDDQHFGASVAVNSMEQLFPPVVAVGAPGADNPQIGDNTGAVYIYEYDGTNWVETAKLTPSRISGAKIGRELIISGDILVVSGSPEAGEVYSFQRETGGWRELAPVIVPASPDGEPSSVLLDLYGKTLALSTFTVPPLNKENYDQPYQRTGIITLYELSGDQWEQVFQTAPQEAFAPIASDGFTAQDENPFGIQVSIGGEEGQASWLAVGKPGYTGFQSSYGGKFVMDPVNGSVVLYQRGDRGWAAQAELMLAPGELAPGALPFFSSDPAAAFFGSSVDIEGSRLAVIATFANTVDVFERQGQDWIYRFRISPGTAYGDDFQLRTVAMSGSVLAQGSPGELGGGEIFIFDLSH